MMATARTKKAAAPEQDAIPQVPQTSMGVAYGAHAGLDAGFIWQQLSGIEKTLGAIDAKLDQHKEAAAKLEGDIAKVKADVAEFKQIRHTAKVLAWVMGVAMAGLIGLTGFVVKEAWNVLKPVAVHQLQQTPPAQPKTP